VNIKKISLILARSVFTILFLAISLIPFNVLGWKVCKLPLEILIPSLIIIPACIILFIRLIEKTESINEYEKWLAIFTVVLIAENFFSINFRHSTKVLGGFVLKGLLVSFVSYNLTKTYKDPLKIFVYIATIVAIFSIPGTLSYWKLPPLLPLYKFSGFYPMLNPLPIAAYLVLSAPLSILLVRNAITFFSKLGATTKAILILASITVTFSRSGYFSAIIAITIYFLLLQKNLQVLPSKQKHFIKKFLPPILSGVGLILLLFILLARHQTISNPLRKFNIVSWYSSHSLKHRLKSYSTVILISSQKIITGIGFGNYPSVHEQYAVNGVELNTPTPDNMYLRFLAETGIVGLCMFLTFLIYWIKKLWKVAMTDLRVAAITGGIIGFCFNMLFADLLLWPATQFAFWTLLGIGAGITNHSSPKEEKKTS